MSTNMLVLINVAILLGLIYLLMFLKKRNISFTLRVFLGMGLGILFGAILQMTFGATSDVVKKSISWFSVVATGYVRLLMMVVIPLVFLSITSAIITQDSKNLGKMATRIIAILLITTAIAATVGAVTTSVFGLTADGLQLGEAEEKRGDSLESTLQSFQAKTPQEQIMEIVPTNPFYAMTGQGSNATLSVVAFAVLLSLAAIGIKKTKPESAEFFIQMIKSLQDVVMRLVTMILRLTPYGVLALMTRMVATSNFREVLRLINFVVANYVALAIVFVIHLLILMFFGLSPVKYLKKGSGTLMFAFSSRSSAGTLPLTIETQTDKFGVAPGFANLAGTLGTSIGQNG